jgi:hypothetical protein
MGSRFTCVILWNCAFHHHDFFIDFSWFTVQVGASSKPPLSRSLVALMLSGEIDGFVAARAASESRRRL